MLLLIIVLMSAPEKVDASCLPCHANLGDFNADPQMRQQLLALAARHGDRAGCVACHEGDPAADRMEDAHRGAPAELTKTGGPEAFYPDPGDSSVADRTCGQCHDGYAERLRKSIMSTNAESIGRELCAAASERRNTHTGAPWPFGLYAVGDDDGPEPVAGSSAYRQLMRSLRSIKPTLFADRLDTIPEPASAPPTGAPDPSPETRHQAQGQRPSQLGCSGCHRHAADDVAHAIPADGAPLAVPTAVQPDAPGPPPPAVSKPANYGWAQVPREACFACHFDPRTVGVNEMGDAFVHYGAPHHASTGGGLLCQDCHTSLEMHGDGNIALASAAQTEVRCEDCHGTTQKFPWELPLGYEGPRAPAVGSAPARGIAEDANAVPDHRAPPKDGYLLTSRGNPFGNVVRDGNTVVLYAAAGFVYRVTLLKDLSRSNAWRSPLSREVKSAPHDHAGMACRECHADWLPPCLGCHVKSASP